MSRRAEHDVIVIGGGPAGCAAARLLASWGHDVVLLTRASNPDRAIGESLPPSCVKLLGRVGLLHAVDAAGFIRSTGNTVRWGVGDERVEHFTGSQLGYQVDRAAFDALLLREAMGAGVHVLEGATALEVRHAPDSGATVRLEHEGNSRELVSSWVLDCTGRTGLVARHGWRVPETAGRTLALVGIWTREGNWPIRDESHTLVESYADGWAWSVPVARDRRYVTVMVDPAFTALDARQMLGVYDGELSKTASVRHLIEGATRTGSVFARDASPYSASRFAEPGVLLVGDAASFVDPLSSYGIKKALASAWLAAVVAHSCITSPPLARAALDLYESRERAMYAALRRRLVDLTRDARSAHPAGFWTARTDAEHTEHAEDVVAEPDVAALRQDPDVLTALRQLKERDSIGLSQSARARRASRAVVRGNRVVMEEHLVVPAFPGGVRYIRNVDLVLLSELAPTHDQVPSLFDAYNRAAPPAPLPDFLGALSVMIGKGMLTFAEHE